MERPDKKGTDVPKMRTNVNADCSKYLCRVKNTSIDFKHEKTPVLAYRVLSHKY